MIRSRCSRSDALGVTTRPPLAVRAKAAMARSISFMPGVRKAAMLRDAANPAGIAQFGAIRASATALGVDVSPINVRDAGERQKTLSIFSVCEVVDEAVPVKAPRI